MNLLEKAKQLKNGAEILTDWLGSGGQVVDHDLAQKRADICLTCPKHTSSWGIVEAAASAIKYQLELKKHLKLRVSGEKSLHVCSACGCVLRLKIWIPIEQIVPDPQEREKFDPHCWLLRES